MSDPKPDLTRRIPWVLVSDPERPLIPGTTIPSDVTTLAGEMTVSRQLMDSIPKINVLGNPVCFHHFPEEPSAHAPRWTCMNCGVTFKAKFKRPKREPAGTCWECGHDYPKGPKMPKKWTWVKVKDE